VRRQVNYRLASPPSEGSGSGAQNKRSRATVRMRSNPVALSVQLVQFPLPVLPGHSRRPTWRLDAKGRAAVPWPATRRPTSHRLFACLVCLAARAQVTCRRVSPSSPRLVGSSCTSALSDAVS